MLQILRQAGLRSRWATGRPLPLPSHAVQLLERLLERPALLQHVRPEIAGLLDAGRRVAKVKGRGRDLAFLDLLPRTRRGHWRTWLRPHCIRCRECCTVAVTSGVHINAAAAIHL